MYVFSIFASGNAWFFCSKYRLVLSRNIILNHVQNQSTLSKNHFARLYLSNIFLRVYSNSNKTINKQCHVLILNLRIIQEVLRISKLFCKFMIHRKYFLWHEIIKQYYFILTCVCFKLNIAFEHCLVNNRIKYSIYYKDFATIRQLYNNNKF